MDVRNTMKGATDGVRIYACMHTTCLGRRAGVQQLDGPFGLVRPLCTLAHVCEWMQSESSPSTVTQGVVLMVCNPLCRTCT